MSRQSINTGSGIGDPTADATWDAFNKSEANFIELYNQLGGSGFVTIDTEQTVTGEKTFSATLNTASIDTTGNTVASGNVSAIGRIRARGNALDFEEDGNAGSSTITANIVGSTVHQLQPKSGTIAHIEDISGGLTARVNITTSQLKDNFPSVPVVELIPSPGLGKFINIKEMYAKLNTGTVAFNNGNCLIKIGAIINSTYNYGDEPTPVPVLKRVGFDSVNASVFENSALTFQTVSGNSTGDGDIDFIINYEILDL